MSKLFKYIMLLIIVILLATSCITPAKNFTNRYKNTYTGLDTLIRTDGYYISQRECDSTFHAILMFYPNGLFTIATTSQILPELLESFEHGGNSHIARYPLWGTYHISNDTIYTQAIHNTEIDCIFFRNYKISANGELFNISDYVEPQYTHLGYMKNYPSFYENQCPKKATFYPTRSKRPETDCPFIREKWFYNK